jgi:hypothetical protein
MFYYPKREHLTNSARRGLALRTIRGTSLEAVAAWAGFSLGLIGGLEEQKNETRADALLAFGME